MIIGIGCVPGDITLEDKPCCAQAAARKTKLLLIGGCSVGIAHLDEIISEIKARGLQSDEEIGAALLEKIKIFNYVPSGAGPEYKHALLEEYKRRGQI